MSVFDTLVGLNVNDHIEKKKFGGTEFTYLSWPWAWTEIKSRYPNAHYEIWKDEKGLPYTYDPNTGYMVYTSVTIDGVTHQMWLPVMDGANNAMKGAPYDYTINNPNFKWAKWDASRNGYFDKYGNAQPEKITKHVDAATMFDINKTIMRCLVKNLAMFGLGLYIYAGEDLPQGETQDSQPMELPKAEDRTPPDASVNVGEQLPPVAAPQPPKKEMTGVQKYIASMIVTMAKEIPSFNFAKMRKALIDGGQIADMPSEKMTMDDAEKMINAIYATFGAKENDRKA